MNVAKSLFLSFGLTFFMLSCQPPAQNYADQLIGKWEMKEAISNGKPTERLASAFFEFKVDGQMQTNLLGEPETSSYAIESNQIHQTGGSRNIDYIISQVNDSTLVLLTTIQSFDFELTLKRASSSNGE